MSDIFSKGQSWVNLFLTLIVKANGKWYGENAHLKPLLPTNAYVK